MKRASLLALAIALFGASQSYAQLPSVRGYYLNVPLWSDSTPLAVGGLGDLQRLRLMTSPTIGPVDHEVSPL